MGALVASILLAQAILLQRAAKSWSFPPALYALYWAGVLAASIFIEFGDYSLSVDALMVFLVGSVLFSIGGCGAAWCLQGRMTTVPTSPSRKKFILNCIALYSIGLFALVPLFLITLQGVSANLGIGEFAVAVRFAFGEDDRAGIPRYFLSLTSVGAILAYCAAWLYEGMRRDKIALGMVVISTLAMDVLTFARTPIYALLVGVFAILAFRRAIRIRFILLVAAMGTFLIVSLGAMLGKGPDFHSGKSPVYAIVENLAIYFVGGPVGFGYVMDNPASVGDPWLSLRFFTQAAASLGADIALPNNVLGYFSDVLGNVYTIYYAYWLDWGWWGVVTMASLAGFLCTAIYMMARKGNPYAGVAIGMIFGAILNSGTGDWIFPTSIPWMLLVLCVSIMWKLPILTLRSSGSNTMGKTTGASL